MDLSESHGSSGFELSTEIPDVILAKVEVEAVAVKELAIDRARRKGRDASAHLKNVLQSTTSVFTVI